MLTQTTPLNISKNFKQATEKTSKLTASSKLSNRNPATEALSRSFQNDFYSVTPEDLYQQKKTTKLIPLLTPGHLDGNEPCCTLQPPETLSPPEPRIWWPCSNSICEITKALLPLQQTGWESRSQRSPRTASYRQRGLGGGFFFSLFFFKSWISRLTSRCCLFKEELKDFDVLRRGNKAGFQHPAWCTTAGHLPPLPRPSEGSTRPAVSPSHKVLISNRPF